MSCIRVAAVFLLGCVAIVEVIGAVTETHKVPEKKDPYGEKKDPYGEKKDPYGEKKDPYGEKKDPYGEKADPYGEKADPYGEKADPYAKDEYADKEPYEGENPKEPFNPEDHKEPEFNNDHTAQEFTIEANMDQKVNVTNDYGHMCEFHFSTAEFEGSEKWELLLFDVETHHECTAMMFVQDHGDETKVVFKSVALVVKDERGTEFGMSSWGAHPGKETQYALEVTDIGYGVHSTKTYQGATSKVAIHFLPKKDEL